MRASAFMWLAALPLAAQDPGAQALFNRVRAHMAETLQAQPNYTCLETVERAIRGAKDKDFRREDLIKLEVALVDGKELFAWPGSKRFDDSDMRKFVPTGMFGNGDFSLYSKEVFAGRNTEYTYRGIVKLGQRDTMRYDFRVPMENGMRISAGRATAAVGYHGSFYAEAETLDVLRLEIVADDLPRSLDTREVTDTMEYARAHIGNGDFLLPSSGEAAITTSRGDASRNQLRFSDCHEFAGESKLRFDDDGSETSATAVAPAPSAVPAQAKREVQLPRNASVELKLLDRIDVTKAAVGDPVRASLNGDVKEKGQVVLPKGTVVTGRIVRLERSMSATVLGLMFEDAESENAHAALSLSFDTAAGTGILRSNRWGTSVPLRPHEGVIPLEPGIRRVERDIIMFWRT